MITENDIEHAVLEYMAQLDVSPAPYERLILDGQLHRYDIDGDKRGSINGVYLIHTDGIPAGFVQDWKRGKKEKWRYNDSNLTEEERNYFNSEEYQAKINAEREKKKQKLRQRQIEAADRSRIICETLPEAKDDHPYLKKKGITAHGVKLNGDILAIPLRDIDGNIGSLQWIDPDGQKRFQPDTALSGLFWSIGLEQQPTSPILLGEGFATMAKIHELTGYPCVAGIACSFLKKVAKKLRERYSEAKIYVMADNDKGTEERRGYNPGLANANNLVKAGLADYVIAPEFEQPEDGTDWDDYALKYGDEVCSQLLEEKLKEAPLKERQEKYRQKAEELGVVNFEEFETFRQPLESTSWIIEDWLPTESLVMIFASSGSGKSFLTTDMAYAIANPHISEWHGKKILKHGPVVYIAGEGQRGLRKRIAGLVGYTGAKTDGVKMAIIKEPMLIDEQDPKGGINRALANIGSIYPEPALIVLDTLAANLSGDENKAADANAFIRSCQKLIQEFGTTIIPVHHTGVNPEAQARARGSSAFKGAMDVEIHVVRNGQVMRVEMTKSKDTEIQPPIILNMLTVDTPGFYKETGEIDTTCVLELNEEMTDLVANGAKTEKPEKTSKAEIFAKDTYQEAAKRFGVFIWDEEREQEVIAVDVENWRNVFYEMSSSDGNEAKRKHFQRSKKLLLEDKHFLYKREREGKEYYFLTPSEDAYESTLKLQIKRRISAEI